MNSSALQVAYSRYSVPVVSAQSQCLRITLYKNTLHRRWSRRCLHSTRTSLENTPAQSVTSLPQGGVYQYVRNRPRAPYRVKPGAAPLEFKVNDDPAKLDAMYIRLLGEEGVKLLPNYIKWQAVTHKSFDHGFQPFNDKLAFMGRRIIFLHANLNILNRLPFQTPKSSEAKIDTVSSTLSTYQAPEPFEHPDYRNIDAATYDAVGEQTSEARLGIISRVAGIPAVMRWKPAWPKDMFRSGQDRVAVECMCAIAGAIGLIRGGHEAEKFVRERILANPDPESR